MADLDIEYVDLSTKTYRVFGGRVVGFVDEIEAMKQLVEKTLTTERFENVIYSDYFGSEFSEILGMPFSYVESDVLRIIEEALLIDERVISIEDFNILSINKENMTVYFVVKTIFGDIEEERGINIDV